MPINVEDLSSLVLVKINELTTEYDETNLSNLSLLSIQVGDDTGKLPLGALEAYIAEDLILTGVPTAPTALQGTNTNQIATCEFVVSELANAGLNPATVADFGTVKTDQTDPNPTVYLSSTVDTFLANKVDSVTLNNYYDIATLDPLLNAKAPLNNPTFTGNVQVPNTPIINANKNFIRTTTISEIWKAIFSYNKVAIRVNNINNSSNINTFLNYNNLAVEVDPNNIYDIASQSFIIPHTGWYRINISQKVQAVPFTNYIENFLIGLKYLGNPEAHILYQIRLDTNTSISELVDIAAGGTVQIFANQGESITPNYYVGMGANGRFNSLNTRISFEPLILT